MGVVAMTIDYNNRTNHGVLTLGDLGCASCEQRTGKNSKIPSSGDVFVVGKITNEPATKIAFPALCNGMSLAGVGVRVKYVFVNVYAVGAYFDPIAMMAVKKGSKADMEGALVDPTYPRTIRIVMNRGLSGTYVVFLFSCVCAHVETIHNDECRSDLTFFCLLYSVSCLLLLQWISLFTQLSK